jgi:hypothetical protein
MLADFPVLYVDAIVRRTLVSSIALAVVALAGGFLLGEALAGAGVVLGLGGATLNHRLFQVSTVRHIDIEGHLDRKPYAGTVAARLGALTAVAFGLLFLVRPMGFGMVGGLIAFQVLLMLNALGALWRYQRRQLASTVPGQPGVVVAGHSLPVGGEPAGGQRPPGAGGSASKASEGGARA